MAKTIRRSSASTTTNFCDLPESVLLHILSFLPIKDAVTTSSLSKAWRYLWAHSPTLRFHQPLITPDPTAIDGWIFSSFVHQVLHRHHQSNLQSLHIQFDYANQALAPHIDTWILIAARNNIRELHLDLSGDWRDDHNSHNPRYNLPLSFLRSVPISVLKISRCNLVPAGGAPFRFLRTLFLSDVELTDETVSGLIDGCQELENLTLESCYGIKHLKISSMRLKDLAIKFYRGKNSLVEIDAPNLASFCCMHYIADEFRFKDMLSLVNAFVHFEHEAECFHSWRNIVKFLSHVRNLTTWNWWGEERYTGMFFEDVFPGSLPQTGEVLEKLFPGSLPQLKTGEFLEKFFPGSLPRLTTSDFFEKFFPGCLPSLKVFKISAFRGTENELELVKFLLKHGMALEEVIFDPNDKYGFTDQPPPEFLAERFQEVRAFPRYSSHTKILLL
ncbi:F-box/FBD/LRR-repeat protein At5g56420-like [Magnolia sinica]|uniref:F-box/FBD/LRR-repeat protein At5g56420-like n=1 Tax=Magnolia sinica TaxID=86752 RepID=UPI002657F027|nr:F-box/FBD/LRR-repeat protein At5g56420-like [Magnolia sinica]